MKVFGFLSAVALLGIAAVYGQAARDSVQPNPTQSLGAGSPPIPVTASTRLKLDAEIKPATVKLGEPINIKFRLTNLSSTPIEVGETYPDNDYDLTVTDMLGTELPRTPKGEKALRGELPTLRAGGGDLEPGGLIEESVNIAEIYQVTRPGTYLVRAMRHFILGSVDEIRASARTPNEPVRTIEKAVSNIVQFTVTP